jgi:hypothetical protein
MSWAIPPIKSTDSASKRTIQMLLAHPFRELMMEAQQERKIADSSESWALKQRIAEAVIAYSDFLDNHNLIWDDSVEFPRLKASSLVVTHDFGDGGSVDINLKDGPIDRVYGNGRNPDPFGAGSTDIPHKPRDQ